MQKLARFASDVEDDKKLKREARRLGLANSDFLRLLIKLYSNGQRPEPRELVHGLDGQK